MFIKNVESIDTKKLYKCREITYRYLKDKLPLISVDNEWYYFSNTDNLRKILEKSPFYIKVVSRWKL